MLDCNPSDPLERWWLSDTNTPIPVPVVPFFGAGVSINSPTNLPAAIPLTQAVTHLLLRKEAAEEVLSIFATHSRVLRRPVPRLEHLLSAAAACTTKAADLLNLFDAVHPNRNHHILAQYLLQTRGWAITTNFDEAVERASGFRIPVHIPDPESKGVKVLHGPPDAAWGLIKLHGTIGQGTRSLAATLEQLTPGLPVSLRELLDHVFSAAQVILVCGYSATDHFDINGFLHTKLNEPYRTRLLWINHRAASEPDPEIPPYRLETPGFEAFSHAFRGGQRLLAGPTVELLAQLLGDAPEPAKEERDECMIWRDKLERSYVPSPLERHRIALCLATEMGLATLAQEAIDLSRHQSAQRNLWCAEEARSLIAEGRWLAARLVLAQHRIHLGRAALMLRIEMLRRRGRPARALFRLLFARPSGPVTPQWHCLITECLLDCYVPIQDTWLGRTWFARASISKLVFHQLGIIRAHLDARPDPSLEIRVQMVALKCLARCSNRWEFENSLARGIRGVIRNEVWPPELFVGGKAAIPGTYISAATTAAELDRLQDLLDVHLAFAEILLVGVKRFQLNTLSTLSMIGRHCLYLFRGRKIIPSRRSYISRIYIHEWLMPLRQQAALVKDQLRKANQIAEMLNDDYARTRVAHAWLQADRALRGITNWKPQRLYLP